jgi:hypothetical protein
MGNTTTAAMATEQPYTSRHKPAPVAATRPYRPKTFNKITRSRFERIRAAELARHLGRPLSYPEKILVTRIVAIEWELLKTDAKLDEGKELSGHDIRGRLAAETRLRLDLVALGLQQPSATASPSAPAPRAMTFSEFMAR